MDAESPSGSDCRGDADAPPVLPCDPTCSDAELYDLLFHYRRIHGMLVRYRAGDGLALSEVARVLVILEAEAGRRGIPLHRLPAGARG